MLEQVILNIQLRRSSPGVPWGFTVRQVAGDYPYIVDKVMKKCLASPHLTPGDAIVLIEDSDASVMPFQEVEDLIAQPSTTLSLQLLKGKTPSASGSVEQQILNIQMQRSSSVYPWGFTVRRVAGDHPYIVHQVTEGSQASLNLTPGDVLLKIEEDDASTLSFQKVEDLITQPSLNLNLQLLKGYGTLIYDSRYSDSEPHQVTRMQTGQETSQISQVPPPPHLNKEISQSDSLNPNETDVCRNVLKKEKESFWDMICRDCSSGRDDDNPIGEGSGSPGSNRKSRLEKWIESGEVAKDEVEEFYNRLPQTQFQKSTNHQSKISRFPSGGISNDNRYHDRVDSPSSNMSHSRELMFDPSKERQGDITFWELDPDCQPLLSKTSNFDKIQKRHSLFSSSSGTPNFSDTPVFPRKLSEHKSQQNLTRLKEFTPARSPMPLENGWKSTNVSVKSGYQKTVSVVNKTYSTVDGVKSLKTYEHLNKTTKNDKMLKTVDGGKEEVTEVTENNKEYVLQKKEEIDGRPKETKKVINEYSKTEKFLNGDNENCILIDERLEENVEKHLPSPGMCNVPRSSSLINKPRNQIYQESKQPKETKYKSELKIDLKGNSKEQLKLNSADKFWLNYQESVDKTEAVQSPISAGPQNYHSVNRANKLRGQQNKIQDETLPPYSEFKNKIDFFSEISRNRLEDNQAIHLPRSSSPALSEEQKPTSSDYWSSEEKSPNDVSLEETKRKNSTSSNVIGNQTMYGTKPLSKNVTKPKTNFKTAEDYLNFIGCLRK